MGKKADKRESRAFQEIVERTAFVTRSVPLACPMCGDILDARVKAVSSHAVDHDMEGAGVMFELVLFATHDCLEDD